MAEDEGIKLIAEAAVIALIIPITLVDEAEKILMGNQIAVGRSPITDFTVYYLPANNPLKSLGDAYNALKNGGIDTNEIKVQVTEIS